MKTFGPPANFHRRCSAFSWCWRDHVKGRLLWYWCAGSDSWSRIVWTIRHSGSEASHRWTVSICPDLPWIARWTVSRGSRVRSVRSDSIVNRYRSRKEFFAIIIFIYFDLLRQSEGEMTNELDEVISIWCKTLYCENNECVAFKIIFIWETVNKSIFFFRIKLGMLAKLNLYLFHLILIWLHFNFHQLLDWTK